MRDTNRRPAWRCAGVLGTGVLVVATLGLPAGDAAAATTSESVSATVDVVGAGSNAITAFDPALGTLTRVDWTVTTNALAQVCIENLSQRSGTSTGGTAGSSLGVTFPAGTTTTSNATVPIPESTLPASNGVDNCLAGYDFATATFPAPVSAGDVVYGGATAPQMTTGNITESAGLTTFVGPGNVPFSYQFNSNASIANPSEWDITFIAEGTLTVTVTYNYVPAAIPPTTTAPATTAPTTTGPGATTTTIASEAPVTTIPAPTTTTIVPTVPTTPGSLPRTGSSTNGTLIAALLALAAGCWLFALSRRRLQNLQ